jgi:hypothetical protein
LPPPVEPVIQIDNPYRKKISKAFNISTEAVLRFKKSSLPNFCGLIILIEAATPLSESMIGLPITVIRILLDK